MELRRMLWIVATLHCSGSVAETAAHAEPLALSGYDASIGESSISGVWSGAFMAVQFATAWSSIIKGVGIVAGGPFWCAEADAYDVVTDCWGPIWRATGSCIRGPASNLKIRDFVAKADSKAAAGDVDELSNLATQKISCNSPSASHVGQAPIRRSTRCDETALCPALHCYGVLSLRGCCTVL